MIISFKHKGLRLLWEKNDSSKLPTQHVKRITVLLQIIDELKDIPKDLEHLVSLRPHKLKGDLKRYWSLDVSGNYRIIFVFEKGDAYDVNYLDTH